MIAHPYTCRFCGQQRVAHYDESCPKLRLEAWNKMLCCDRCHDYHVKRLGLAERISRLCLRVALLKNADKFSAEFEDAARQKLVRLTKDYAANTCAYRRVLTNWHPEFVEHLLSHPDKQHIILSTYEDQARKAGGAT